jgi:hypothetical protein
MRTPKVILEISHALRKLTGKTERAAKSENPFVRKMRAAKAAKHRKKK